MKMFEKRIKPEVTEDTIPVTKQPDKTTLSIWYDVSSRAMRDRYNTHNVCVKNRVLTEGDLGQIFYKLGIPPKLPSELHEWALSLSSVYFRLLPTSAV
jgi:hypothetical protein